MKRRATQRGKRRVQIGETVGVIEADGRFVGWHRQLDPRPRVPRGSACRTCGAAGTESEVHPAAGRVAGRPRRQQDWDYTEHVLDGHQLLHASARERVRLLITAYDVAHDVDPFTGDSPEGVKRHLFGIWATSIARAGTFGISGDATDFDAFLQDFDICVAGHIVGAGV